MRVGTTLSGAFSVGLLAMRSTVALDLNMNDPNSIKSAARTLADGMMFFYHGNESGQVPGLLPQPYYWWEAGAMFGALIDYWYYTGDSTYNGVVSQAMQFQVGENADYTPANESQQLGNDDQAFWGMAAMSAAEVNFPNPPADKPQWLALAQAVFNSQVTRWNPTTCGGGLNWQISPLNLGYSYKNSVSNGGFFNIATRLYRYTGNETYADWAIKMWNWCEAIGLIGSDGTINDGSESRINCTELDHRPWTYNAGTFLIGASVMWNMTTGADQQMWEQRARKIITASHLFFQEGNIMKEVVCEDANNCDLDQQSFKAYLSRWMAYSIKVAPFVEPLVSTYLQSSAAAAAKACSGGDTGRVCGGKWTTQAYDGTTGVGQQMSALEVIQGLLIDSARGPLSMKTGGTSEGNPNAGTAPVVAGPVLTPITTGSKAAAGILTALALAGTLAGAWYGSRVALGRLMKIG